ncbi:universal stress protein [Halovulum marinum]|nr:universal stress protein [Halovulum marinum]
MYNNILVPIDVSHEDVAKWILGLAGRLVGPGGKITALHVIPEVPAYTEAYVPKDVRTLRDRDLQKLAETLVKDAGLSTAHVRLERGGAYVRILEVIDQLEPDLVIIGSHRPGFTDIFLGSTAARVVRHAPCSVLVDRHSVQEPSV